MTDALVRECIQNSLDAGIAGRPVIVRFKHVIVHPSLRKRYAPWFSSLEPHIEAEHTGLVDPPSQSDPLTILLIEDFGTRGLEGNTQQDNDLATGSGKNDFFYFWRNVGRSAKGQDDRGRWGLGKTVFQASSRINSFFGLAVRQSDGQSLLMGQSVLKTHLMNGTKHYPYGWFGRFEGDFALPVSDEETIKDFSKDFTISRGDAPGLSVVVPFPDESITYRRIAGSVVVHYFFPILAGMLSVEIVGKDRTFVINRGSITEMLKVVEFEKTRFKAAGLKGLFELAGWALSVDERSCIQLNRQNLDKVPEWGEQLFDGQALDALRARFESGERLAFRVPLPVRQKGAQTHDAFFHIFLERDAVLETAEDHFVREGITISGVRSLRQKGVRAIVSIGHGPLSALLGDAENPAHTEWQERSPKFRGKYIRGASCLRFVKNSPRELVRILSAPAQGRDEGLLKDVFFVDIAAGAAGAATGPVKTDKAGAGENEPGATAAANGEGSPLQIVAVKGGFRIGAPRSAGTVPRFFRILAACAIRRGDPFARYSTFDFEMNKQPLQVRGKGIRLHSAERNQMVIETTAADFLVEVTGFDIHRDLIVKTEILPEVEP
jgi:hypothetical protein